MTLKKQLAALMGVALLLTTVSFPWSRARADEGSGDFTITDVTPASFSNEADQIITLAGSGFLSDLVVGLHPTGTGEINSLDDVTSLSTTVVSSEQITAVVPAGTAAGQFDIFLYEPNANPYYFKEAALEIGSLTTTDTPELQFNESKSAVKKINITYQGLALTKKRWVKANMNGRKVPILKLRRTGNSTVVTINLKYKNWPIGGYSLVLTYKNRLKVKTINKKGKVKYRKTWEHGRVESEGILSIRQ